MSIESLSLEDGQCDLCGIEVVRYDREWIAPGTWEHHLTCPGCDRETTVTVRGGYVYRPSKEGIEQDITETYLDTDMSVECLERSLDRLWGLA